MWFTVALIACLALAAGGLVGWHLATGRARLRAEARLREVDGTARAAQATADELRRSLAAAQDEARTRQGEAAQAQQQRVAAETQVAELRRSLEGQKQLLDKAEEKLSDTFRALAAEALAANNEGFLTLAREKLGAAREEGDAHLEARQKAIEALLRPVRESLDKVDGKIQALEVERGKTHAGLSELVKSLAASHDRLSTETGNLVRALRAPAVRGRWGEIQLQRVVELAGMREHCDFSQQQTLASDAGRLRPDLIVHLPNGHEVVVDAKVPLEAYLAAVDAAADEGQRQAQLRRHGEQVRAHVLKLSSKAYWSELASAPDFVVLFLPSEGIYHAALEVFPALIEEGVGHKVIIATPTTLIALLQAVHYGWRQERLAQNAQAISEQGRLVHERLAILFEHLGKVGTALGRATDSYNAALASFEGRLRPAVRRLEELGAAGKRAVPDAEPVDVRPRGLVPELPRLELAGPGDET